MSDQKRSGLYYWAGPGTIRMIRLKFPGARINIASLLKSYDVEVLQSLKEKLHLTDAWVSFSWGFSAATEREDYRFTTEKLKNFDSVGIKTHGYIQGCNLVFKEHPNSNYFCRDFYGRFIPYHRGRKMTCPNNPYFQEYMHKKINLAVNQDFSGIFIDNVNFGQLPLKVAGGYTTFFGCNCSYCQKSFKEYSGTEIPKLFKIGSDIFNQYVQFREKVLTTFLKSLARIVHEAGKEFGTNSFDPKYDTHFLYGVNLEALNAFQDYLLFENHDLPRFGKHPKSNSYLKKYIRKATKPIFVVSYKKGIGRDAAYLQSDFDAIYTESKVIGYSPCYKGTEFVTCGIWHTIDSKSFNAPKITPIPTSSFHEEKLLKGKLLLRFYNRLYNPFLTAQFENKYARRAFSWLYYRAIR